MSERLDAADVYGWHRRQLVAMALQLTQDQLLTTVPACPAWTVRDLYAHLAGVASDVASADPSASIDPKHTQGHVDQRAARSLAEVCGEWDAHGPAVEQRLRDTPGFAAPALDAWSHYNDIRGALGLPRGDDGAVLQFAVAMLAAGRRRAWGGGGLPTLRVVGSHRDWQFGEGQPVATLSADDYELARLFMGRRSPAQLRAMDWEGDPEPFVGHLNVFGPPDDDLTD